MITRKMIYEAIKNILGTFGEKVLELSAGHGLEGIPIGRYETKHKVVRYIAMWVSYMIYSNS